MGRALDPLTQLEATEEDWVEAYQRCEKSRDQLKRELAQLRKEARGKDEIIEAARKVAAFPCHRGEEPLHKAVRDLREALESRGIPAG